jgi:hypothetical protein
MSQTAPAGVLGETGKRIKKGSREQGGDVTGHNSDQRMLERTSPNKGMHPSSIVQIAVAPPPALRRADSKGTLFLDAKRRQIGREVARRPASAGAFTTEHEETGHVMEEIAYKMSLPWERKRMEKRENAFFTKLQTSITELARAEEGGLTFALRGVTMQAHANSDESEQSRGMTRQVTTHMDETILMPPEFCYDSLDGPSKKLTREASLVSVELETLYAEYRASQTEEVVYEPEPGMQKEVHAFFKDRERKEELAQQARDLRRLRNLKHVSKTSMQTHVLEKKMKAHELRSGQQRREKEEQNRLQEKVLREEESAGERKKRELDAENQAREEQRFEEIRMATRQGKLTVQLIRGERLKVAKRGEEVYVRVTLRYWNHARHSEHQNSRAFDKPDTGFAKERPLVFRVADAFKQLIVVHLMARSPHPPPPARDVKRLLMKPGMKADSTALNFTGVPKDTGASAMGGSQSTVTAEADYLLPRYNLLTLHKFPS